jgi:inner membrane transporter RhtA
VVQKPAASSSLVGVALVIGSCLSLPFGAAVAAQLFPVLGPWGVTSLRVAIAAILLVVIVRPRRGSGRSPQWLAAVLFGVSLAAMNGFFYAAIDRIPLGPAVAIEFLGPLVLAAVLTRRLADSVWVGVALLGMARAGHRRPARRRAARPARHRLHPDRRGLLGHVHPHERTRRHAHPRCSGLAMGLVVAAVLLIPIGMPAASTVAMRHAAAAARGDHRGALVGDPVQLRARGAAPPAERVFGVLLSLEPAFATLAGWLVLGQERDAAADAGDRTRDRRERRHDARHPSSAGRPPHRRRPDSPGPFTAPIPLPD